MEGYLFGKGKLVWESAHIPEVVGYCNFSLITKDKFYIETVIAVIVKIEGQDLLAGRVGTSYVILLVYQEADKLNNSPNRFRTIHNRIVKVASWISPITQSEEAWQ